MPNLLEGERALGPTYAADQIGWLDFESKSETDVRKAGGFRYATEADPVVLAWAIGDEPPQTMAVKRFPGAIRWADVPRAVRDHHYRVTRGKAIWAAWNAGFDRALWNYAAPGFPFMEPFHIIDVMAQAQAAGLPPDLFMASRECGGAEIKQKDGRQLLIDFCLPGATKTPQTHPEDWQRLLSYARDDIASMRAVFRCTRQLSRAEWQEYWAMERINDNGVMVDLPMVEVAAELADIDRRAANTQIKDILLDNRATVDTVARLVGWMVPRLPPAGLKELTKREEETDDDGVVTKPAKYQLTRRRVQKLLAFCHAELEAGQSAEYVQRLQEIERVLQLRFYGGSKTPAKFNKILHQHVSGKLYGQYVFNGAAQTGRASSKGVQVHNLARDTLPYEHEAIEALLDGVNYNDFAVLGDDTPVSRKLSLLIRTAFIAAIGNVFVWSDWSQIEARVLPWLVGDDRRAKARLKIFADVDADPSLPDLYTRTAAALSHVSVEEVTKAMRQRGKVAELALGFCGGVAALQAMAASYNLYLSDEEAKQIVQAWREANPWCMDFSKLAWQAVRDAMENPTADFAAGRVSMIYLPDYLEGSLLIMLPSGRLLTYRAIRWQHVDVLDEDDKPTGEKKLELMFSRGHGRIKLWPGMILENITQATAADFLRGTLRRLVVAGHNVQLHTHDEIVLEAKEDDAERVRDDLRYAMRAGFDWSEGLPIMSEETISPYYTKQEF